ncbi:MAG: hypothetical protein C5B54_03145 [Acidobacteria bacterium]|nr:MAG: hypothetical protein C5B54_03145 [Acidobacteriota bacterium]
MLLDLERQIDEYGDYLYGYILRRVHQPEVAEELLRQTFQSAGNQSLPGHISEREWLRNILKDTMILHFEKTILREIPLDLRYEGEFQTQGEWMGHWNEEPAAAMHIDQIDLRSPLMEVFVLREMEGMSVEEISRCLHLEKENVLRILHLARLKIYLQSSRTFSRARASVGRTIEEVPC